MPTTPGGLYALQKALENNKVEDVTKILHNFDVISAKNMYRWNCLMVACRYSVSPEAMKVVLKKFEEIGGPDLLKSQLAATNNSGQNCLMLCSYNSESPEVVKLILEKIKETGGPDLLKSQLTATDEAGRNCFMLCSSFSPSPEVTKLFAAALFHVDLFKEQFTKLRHAYKNELKEKAGIDSSSWVPDAASLAEVKAILRGPASDKKAQAEEEAAAKMPTTQKDFDAFETALRNSKVEDFKKILHDFDLTATDGFGRNCLMFACECASSPEVVKLILAKIEETGGPNLLKSLLTATEKNGCSCLMFCAGFSNSPEVVKFIFEKIEETGGPDLLKSLLTATDNNGKNCLMRCRGWFSSVQVTKLFAAVLFHFDLFKEQFAKLDNDDKNRLKEKTGIDYSSSWSPDAASLAEVKAILRGPASAKKAQAEEEAATNKKAEDEAALAKKKAEEEAALAAKKKAHDEEAVLAKKKADENAAAKEKAREESVTRKTSETRSSPFGIPRVNKGELGIDFSSTPIGSGATCSVYSCRYFHTVCAVKIFQSHITSDRVVQREMNAAIHLKHPNIVNVLAIIVDDTDKDKIIGILMQRMNGTLLQRVSNTSPYEDAAPPTASDLIKWCSQTASAILCAHSLKCIHCDIKPENVMLDIQDVAHLTDFGSAHVMTTAATKVTSVRGTALYIAPEYAAGDVEGPNEKTDVFSFGMLMWVVLHSNKDHGMGKNEIQIGRSLDRGKRPEITNKDLPAEVISLIEKCWHEEADERPEMADVLTVFNQVIAKIEDKEKGADSSTFKLTPSPLWTDARFLKTKYGAIAEHLSSLKWSSPENAPSLHFSEDITDKNSPLVKFIEQKFRPSPGFKKAEENDSDTQFSGKFSRLQMVQPADAHSLFLALHEADGSSRFANSFLRHKNNADSATQNALEKLRSVFEDPDCNPLTNKQNFSRILFGWHGTNAAIADLVCRDGPRSLRLTDAGFFGAGSYFSLEADYAANYAYMSNTNAKGEYAIILFAVSVSQTYPMTLEHDYRSKEDANRPEMHGFSNFYNGPDPKKAIALAPKCDSHFIPVKKHGDGKQHPLGKYDTVNGNAVVEKDKTRVACNLDQQACDAKDPEVNGHEVLILNHQRAVPLAVMYFK